MREIGFSYDYPKLQGQTEATLLAMFPLKLTKESRYPELLKYDTLQPDGDAYPLRNGEYVVLLFLGNKDIPFTTIRSRIGMYGLNKEEYYGKHIGERFRIRINPPKEA